MTEWSCWHQVLSNSILVGLDLATLSQHQASLPQVQVRTNLILFPLLVLTHFRWGYHSRQILISSINLIPIHSINSIPINLTSSIPISLIPPNLINLIPTNLISLIPIHSISSMLLRSISPTPISSISQHPISSTHQHSVHLLHLLHLPQWFSLLELHLWWSWIDTVVQWRIKAVVQQRNFRNKTIWSSDRLMIKQDPWIHIKDCCLLQWPISHHFPPGLHHSSPAYQSFCRLCCTHSWQFHPCLRFDWHEIWLAWSMIGMKHWHWCSWFRFIIFCLIFQWLKAVFFLQYRIILFYRRHPVFSQSISILLLQPVFIPLMNRQMTPCHQSWHALLEHTWTLTVPCSPSGFQAVGSWLYCSLRVWGCIG